MLDTKTKFLGKILDDKAVGADEGKSFTEERQQTAQAFVLHIEYKDGRGSEDIPWMRFVRANLKDYSNYERLTLLFDDCVVEIDGYNLKPIENGLRECKLNGISEMLSQQITLKRAEGTGETLISAITCYPEIGIAVSRIKGEDDDQQRHVKRVAGR